MRLMRLSHSYVNAVGVDLYVILPISTDDGATFSPPAMDAPWLKTELGKHGRSQTALAKFLGLDQSAVNRMCKGERQIKVREADKIRAYLAATRRHGDTDPTDNVDASTEEGATFIRVEGVVEAGAWREAFASPSGPDHIPMVASAMLEGDVFALKVAGPSMNEFYPDGSYVVVRRWAGGPLPVGKHVVVQRVRPDGLYECTVKELRARPGNGRYELWPRSRDPAYQAPIGYETEGDLPVEIIGRVIAGLTLVE